MKPIVGVFCAFAAVAVSSGAQAQDWQFNVTPYAWLSGLNGQVGTIPGAPPVDVDLSFSDILDDLKFAGMLMASARKGPWVFYLDTTLVRTSTTESLGGALFNSATIDSDTSTFALAVGRTISQSSRGSLDAYLGARAWWLDNTFVLNQVGGGTTVRNESADWVSPLIGVAGRYVVSPRWNVFGMLEVGGFGTSSSSEWSIMAGASYQINDRFAASFGWRHMDVEYSDAGVLFDVRQSGPVMGLTIRF